MTCTNYSQLGQDLFVLDYFKNAKGLYFVDVGANDGITLSNTYLLEKDFEWKGVCIEPDPEVYKKLVENRTCHTVNKPVYNASDVEVQFQIRQDSMLSGISEYLKRHTTQPNKELTLIKTKTLTDILDEAKAPRHIQYLSLDTEGSEYEILKGLDFSKYSFEIIDVEHNYVEPTRSDIRNILEKNGYKYHSENKWDDRYLIMVPTFLTNET